MLHDPKRDRTPSLAGFALFVAGKPRDDRYDWVECHGCAVGQYLASLGVDIPLEKWGDSALSLMNRLASGTNTDGYAVRDTWTFGRLSDRILAHQRAETVA